MNTNLTARNFPRKIVSRIVPGFEADAAEDVLVLANCVRVQNLQRESESYLLTTYWSESILSS